MTSAKLHYKNLLVTLLLGFSSGLPLALTGSTLQAWFAGSNVSYFAIGALSLIGMPYIYKFLWAPLLDRYIPVFLGRRRGWLVILQTLLLLAIIAISYGDPIKHPIWLTWFALIIAFLSATQDIGIDAYRTDILNARERGLGASLNNLGYRTAMMVSGGLCLIMADHFGWQKAYLFMASLMMIGLVASFIANEPAINEEQIPSSLHEAVRLPFHNFFQKPGAWLILAFIVFYKFGDALSLSLLTPFLLRYLHFSLTIVGSVSKGVGLVAGILGSIAGGLIMIRLPLYRALLFFGVLQIIAIAGLLALSIVGKNIWMLTICIAFDSLFNSMGNVALVAYLMSICDPRFTATQFALLTAFASFGRVFTGPLAGFMVEHISWPAFFSCAILFSIIGLIILKALQKSFSI